MAKKEGPTARLKPRPFKTRSKPEFLHFRAEQQQLSARRNRRHRENALILCWECRTCRGPFGFAQGRLFDYIAASLREAATPLRMTFYVGRVHILGGRPATAKAAHFQLHLRYA